MNVAFKLLRKVISVCEFALFQFVKCFFGIIDFQELDDVSYSETTEIIQPAFALPKFYILSSKVRACIFIFSGFRFVSICRSDKTSASVWLHLLTFPFGVYRIVFSHRNLSIFILHWVVGCQGLTVRFYS